MSISLISVIIPVFNHYQCLPAALRSILNQTIKNQDIIIVDDGSAATRVQKFVNDILPKYPQIKFIQAEHKGASAARNRGFAESSSEYVIFWDADIVGEPRMLEKMLQALEANPADSYVYSSFKFGWKKFNCGQFNADKLRRGNYITTASLIRREHFPGFDEALKRFQDWDLWLTMLEKEHTGVWVPEMLFQIINTRGTMSRWLPSFAYKIPWRWFGWRPKSIADYEKALDIVKKKHGL